METTSLNEIDRFIQIKKEELEDPLPDDEDLLKQAALEIVPQEYHAEYLDVFSKVEADKLPLYRPVDYRIELEKEVSELGYSPLYKMSLKELEICRNYVLDQLKKRAIDPSSAP